MTEAAICRRFARGIDNFQRIYKLLAEAWALPDNSGNTPIKPESSGNKGWVPACAA